MRDVKNQMANFKNLIPYIETSSCADQKSYKNHDDPKHLSTVIALERHKKWAKLAYSKGSPPFRGKFEELLKYAMHHHGSYMISYQPAMNFQRVRLDF